MRDACGAFTADQGLMDSLFLLDYSNVFHNGLQTYTQTSHVTAYSRFSTHLNHVFSVLYDFGTNEDHVENAQLEGSMY